jgi:hypothetical protein
LKKQSSIWKGEKVTSRMGDYTDASRKHRQYTLRGKPAECDRFNVGVQKLYKETNAGKQGGKRSETPKPNGRGVKRVSPPPRHKQSGRKERGDRSVSPPPRHKQSGRSKLHEGERTQRRMDSNPYAPHREVNPYAPHREVNPYAPHREVNPYAPHREVNPYAPHREVNPYAPHREVNPYAHHRGVVNFGIGALSEKLESVTITTITYSFVSKPKHTNPHTPGTEAWTRWEVEWNGGEC